MQKPIVASLALLLAASLAPVAAQDLGGGAPASHGRVPRFVLDSWIPGTPSALSFVDLPAAVTVGAGIISGRQTNLTIPGVGGILIADPTVGVAVSMGTTLPLGTLPPVLQGASLLIQGVFLDTSTGPAFTDATRVRFHNPVVMVGNQRQSANSISVIDIVQRAVVDRLGNSENGGITFSPDRTRAYVCEPGSQRNIVTVYDLTVQPIAFMTSVPVTGGIRYRADMAPSGSRLYVPIHNGVDIVDTDPASATYHTVIATIPTPIVGNAGSIFTGPIDVAVTPDGQKLFIAFGENLTWPQPSTVGVVDLNQPGFPYRAIPVTTGGDFFSLATRSTIRISPDGRFAFTVEYGVPFGFPLSNGFQNGALVNVIDTVSEREVVALPTNGAYQQEIALDSLGRNLWIPQVDFSGIGQVLRIDTDRRSPTRFQLISTIQIDPVPYSATTGPSGVDVTPDGTTVLISISEDTAHPTPVLMTIDARTNALFGTPITVESLPATVSAQR